MNNIVLSLFSMLMLAGMVGCAAGNAISMHSEEIASAAAEIANFDLPTGYKADFSAKLAGYIAAAYHPGDGHSHLYLVQSDKESDSEKLAQMLSNMIPGLSDTQSRMTIVENRPATIRGQAVNLIISEGFNSDGGIYRQVTAAFQGRGGPALLVLSEPITRWNQANVEAFISSIR